MKIKAKSKTLKIQRTDDNYKKIQNELLKNLSVSELIKKISDKNNNKKDMKKTRLKELKQIFNILECNIDVKNKKKYIKNIYTSSNKQYDETMFYKCSNSKCLKCKREKTYNYISDRFLNDKIYFITISTPFIFDNYDSKFDEKVKKFRLEIKNVFSYLKLEFISSLEVGSKGVKLHIHLIVFHDDKYTQKYITSFLKSVTGYYCFGSNLKNISSDKDKANIYISKLIGYSSKFKSQTDKIDIENYIDIDNNIIYLFKNYKIDKEKLDKLHDNKVITSQDFITNLIELSKKIILDFEYKKIKNINNNTNTFNILLSYVVVSHTSLYYKVLKDISNNAIKKQIKNKVAYISDNNLKVEKTLYDVKTLNDITNFNKNFIQGVINKINYYSALIDFFNTKIDYEKIINLSDLNKTRVYSNIFFTSAIKKRIASNISLKKIDKTRIIEKDKYLAFINKKELYNKKISDKDLKEYSINQINKVSSNFRIFRIENLIINKIIKTSVLKTNKHYTNLKEYQQIIDYAINKKAILISNKYKNSRNKDDIIKRKKDNLYSIYCKNHNIK